MTGVIVHVILYIFIFIHHYFDKRKIVLYASVGLFMNACLKYSEKQFYFRILRQQTEIYYD
jgi:hypothetical protein